MKFFGLRKYLFFLFVCLACANVFAQTEQAIDTLYEEEYYDDELYLNLFSFSLTNQIPVETFAKNVSGTNFGYSASYYNNFSKKDDFYWGLYFTNFKIDKLTNSYNVQEQFIEFDVYGKTKTSLIFVGYALRYFPDIYTPKIEPFIDVKFGPNFIFTTTSDTIDNAAEAELSFENSDVSMGYAVGIGAQYNVRRGQALHLMVNYHGGTSATYYINGEKGFEIPFDNFVRKTTQLDYVQIAFGLTFGF